jgi:hypothetical protein
MPCVIESSTLFDAEPLPRPARQPAAKHTSLTVVGLVQRRFIPDSTQTDPECVLGDEGPVVTKKPQA